MSRLEARAVADGQDLPAVSFPRRGRFEENRTSRRKITSVIPERCISRPIIFGCENGSGQVLMSPAFVEQRVVLDCEERHQDDRHAGVRPDPQG